MLYRVKPHHHQSFTAIHIIIITISYSPFSPFFSLTPTPTPSQEPFYPKLFKIFVGITLCDLHPSPPSSLLSPKLPPMLPPHPRVRRVWGEGGGWGSVS